MIEIKPYKDDDCSKKKEQFIRESKMFDNYAVKIGDVIPSKDYKDIYQKKEYKKEINYVGSNKTV